jgi:hypothetical protein
MLLPGLLDAFTADTVQTAPKSLKPWPFVWPACWSSMKV